MSVLPQFTADNQKEVLYRMGLQSTLGHYSELGNLHDLERSGALIDSVWAGHDNLGFDNLWEPNIKSNYDWSSKGQK